MTHVPASSPIPLAGMSVSTDIQLVAPLGSGAMGAVWKADHHGLNKPVAVKFIAADLRKDPTLQRRFEREAQAAAQVQTPHVVEILDQGVTPRGMPFIAMELLEGETLAELLERERSISPRRVAVIVAQVSKALDGAHRRGIVHRDIKPENIFLVATGEDMLVKVLDFGVAKVAQSCGLKLTMGETVLGTPYYVSAEQIRSSHDVTLQADLWSLAVVCFEALTGRVPFDGANVAALFLAIQDGNYPAPSTLRPELTEAIDGWFTQAFHRDLGARFPSAKDFASSFLRVAATMPAVFDEDEDYEDWLRTGQFRIPSIPPSSQKKQAGGAPSPRIDIPAPPLVPAMSARSPSDEERDDSAVSTQPQPRFGAVRIEHGPNSPDGVLERDDEEMRATLALSPRPLAQPRPADGAPQHQAMAPPEAAAPGLGTALPQPAAGDALRVDPLAETAFDGGPPGSPAPSTEPVTVRRPKGANPWLVPLVVGLVALLLFVLIGVVVMVL